MSIVSSEAVEKYPELTHPAHGYIPMDIPETYDIRAVRAAYIAGASRQLTEEEIKAACLAIMPYVISQPSRQVFDFLTKATGAYPGQEIVRKVIDAIRGKATEE